MTKKKLDRNYLALKSRVQRSLRHLPQPVAYVLNRKAFGQFDPYGRLLSSHYSLDKFHELRAIFIRIPKAGSQSVARSLFDNLGMGHYGILDFKLMFSPADYKSYFKFAVVRNPVDRVVSSYFFLRKGGVSAKDRKFAKEVLVKYKSFEDFITNGLANRNILEYPHFTPQSSFICNAFGKLQVDAIFHLETLDTSFPRILNQLGIHAELLHINKTKRPHRAKQELDIRLLSKIESVYRKDFRLLGYSTKSSLK